MGIRLHGSNPRPLMSALGQKQTLRLFRAMSALPPKADMGTWPCLGSAQKVRQHSLPLRSWRHEESQVESSEHQDNANIHYQSFPESVSKEHEIYTDYNGCHR